jgi:4-amino-4-deoxy-L-arabinose transferase-like glycosyltransferase
MVKKISDIRVEQCIFWLIALALGIKLIVFLYIAFVDPRSIMQVDSLDYLTGARSWMQYLNMPAQGFRHSLFRTPGYSLFLAIFHLALNLPLLSIILLQFVLNIGTAYVVFKTVAPVDRRTGLLSAAIVLLDLPTTIYSSMILTESLHLFLLALFIYVFIKYIHNRRLKWLAGASLLLVAAVYIRPVGYFLGFAIGGFILFLWGRDNKILTGIIHAIAVLVLVYGLLGLWQYHNGKVYNQFIFSSIDKATVRLNGIIGRYAKETDMHLKAMPPVLYYVSSVGQNFMNLMTMPGNMKYFHSKVLEVFGAVFGYVFVFFWWSGLILNMRSCQRDVTVYFLFSFLLYFVVVTLVSTGWHVTPRFRIPVVPALALLSARGWITLF